MLPVGWVVLGGLVFSAGVTFRTSPWRVPDVGMIAFACLSIAVPVASRMVASTDGSARLVSPILIPLVYFVAVVVNRWAHFQAVRFTATIVAAASMVVGVGAALGTPDRVSGSAGSRAVFAPDLYDLVEALPDEVTVLTNSPQRVWWHTDHHPVGFAFTQPKPGNSHFPLSPDATVRRVCETETYLAWFQGLDNAEGRSPADLRPDLAKRIALRRVAKVRHGALYELAVIDPDDCGRVTSSEAG